MSTDDTMSIKPESPSVRPAFPVRHDSQLHSEWNGLSKREYVATHLLSGLLAQRPDSKDFDYLAALAVKHADELLLQLQDST